MPIDLVTVANAFNGIEIAVLVYMVVEMRRTTALQISQGQKIDKLAESVAKIKGRLQSEEE